MTVLAQKLKAQAELRPDQPALISDNYRIDWEGLDRQVRGVSAWLRSEGLGKGDHIALLCPNRPAYVICWLAIANLGAVAVTINTGLVGDGLRYTIEQSDSKAILCERAMFEEKREHLEPVLPGRICLMFDDELDLATRSEPHIPDNAYTGHGNEPLSIIYTSGTTGLPKGVLNSHQAFIASGEHMVAELGITDKDRIMVFLPLFHTNPQMYAVMSALTAGAALVIRPKFSVSNFFPDAQKFECTVFTYVGTVMAMLTSRMKQTVRDHSLTRCVGGGCSAETIEILKDRFGITAHELYGMTEVGGWITCNSQDRYRLGTCGQLRSDIEMQIVDDKDCPMPVGAPGEIIVRPKAPDRLLKCYWKNPEASLESMRNLWFHTGDTGSVDRDGYLTFYGRNSEVIRRGGENISPYEIETALLGHPKISDAAVVGVPDQIFGQEIKAVIVINEAIETDELMTYLGARVASFMLPRFVAVVRSISRTETQKVRRAELTASSAVVFDLAANRPTQIPTLATGSG